VVFLYPTQRMVMNAGSAQLATTAVALDDLELVHATQNGDASAFEKLVSRYDRKLFRIVQRLTNNREDSQDAVQETFLRVFQHLGEFREDSQFCTWLFRIAVNQAYMKLRKRKTREVSLGEDGDGSGDMLLHDIADWAPSPEEIYRLCELRDILDKTSRNLSPQLLRIFVLRDIEGLSIDQTARLVKVTHSAVKARLRRARLCLRELLRGYFSQHEKPF
jgi:RNA polymerase sigma-70 factor (ECF subfamily)